MKKGFTLAEILITLAVIGVVAALTIPAVVNNTNQSEYKVAFKKAVSVLNQSVSLSLANNSKTPMNATSGTNLLEMLQSGMNTVAAASSGGCDSGMTVEDSVAISGATNADKCSFTTTDGMQYVLPTAASLTNGVGSEAGSGEGFSIINNVYYSGCKTGHACYLLVDVNGDKAPNELTKSINDVGDRFIIMIKGSDGSTLTPAGYGANVVFE